MRLARPRPARAERAQLLAGLAGENAVGDLGQVVADDVGVRVDRVAWHAWPGDEGRSASGGERASDVPGMCGDERHVRRRNSERAGGELVGLAPRLERSHRVGERMASK